MRAESVFDTFPWPQSPVLGQIAEVAAAAVALRALRRAVMAAHGWSCAPSTAPSTHPATNPLRTAYAMPAQADPLAFLLALNLTLAAQEKAAEKITPPGLPLPESERAPFTTADCVRVAN